MFSSFSAATYRLPKHYYKKGRGNVLMDAKMENGDTILHVLLQRKKYSLAVAAVTAGSSMTIENQHGLMAFDFLKGEDLLRMKLLSSITFTPFRVPGTNRLHEIVGPRIV
jgi:hypothetical protein